MVYNSNNIPLENVVLLFETGDLKYLSNSWLPKFILRKKYKQFADDFNRWFNDGDSEKLKSLVDSWLIVKMKNQAFNLYPALYISINYSEDEHSISLYNDLFGEYPGKKEALKRLISKISTIKDKLTIIDKAKKEKESIPFSKIIPIIEISRNIPIDRKISLFEFKQIYDIELEKWQQNK